MPCPEIVPLTLHHKRSVSDIENGPECSCSTDSRCRPFPSSLPSLSGRMKRMKIDENDNVIPPNSELLSPFIPNATLDCGLCTCNTVSNDKFLIRSNSNNRDGHHVNAKFSISKPPSHSLHPLPADIENTFGRDNQGNNQLHRYISGGNTEAALQLIKQAPSFDLLSIENADGQTALHLAALTNQPSLARSLICAGAVVDAPDGNSKTPLHLACEKGFPDVVQCLLRPVDYTETLDNRYKIPFQRIPQKMELTDNDGNTCLALALMKNHFNVAAMLIDSGVFVLSPGLEAMVLDIVSRSDNEEDDDSEEDDSKQDTLTFGDRHEESDNQDCRTLGKSIFIEQDDHLSDRDLSIVLE